MSFALDRISSLSPPGAASARRPALSTTDTSTGGPATRSKGTSALASSELAMSTYRPGGRSAKRRDDLVVAGRQVERSLAVARRRLARGAGHVPAHGRVEVGGLGAP